MQGILILGDFEPTGDELSYCGGLWPRTGLFIKNHSSTLCKTKAKVATRKNKMETFFSLSLRAMQQLALS